MPTKSETNFSFKPDPKKSLIVCTGRKEPRVVAEFVEVLGRGTDIAEPNRHYLEIAFSVDGQIERLVVPHEELCRPSFILRNLAGRGYRPPAKVRNRRLLLEYLTSAEPADRFRISSGTGWVGKVYMRPDGHTIPTKPKERLILNSSTKGLPENVSKGTLSDWQTGVAERATQSSVMMFAIGAALASVLLPWANVENVTFHLVGASTSGKTVAELAALSVHERANRHELPSWNATPVGIQELAIAYSGRLLVLDETGHIDKRALSADAIREVAFAVSAGRSRKRSKHYIQDEREQSWRLLVLSSGEAAASEYANRAGRRRLKGEQVRLIDVPVGGTHGVFDCLSSGEPAAKLASEIEAESGMNFGKPVEAFIRGLRKPDKSLRRLEKRIGQVIHEFLTAAGVPENGFEQRFARPFGLVYAAILLAIECKVLPWKRKRALEAVIKNYERARQAIRDTDAEHQNICEKVRVWLLSEAKVVDARALRRSGNPERKAGKADAFLKKNSDGEVFYAVRPKALKKVVGDSLPLEEVETWFLKIDALLTTDPTQPKKQVQIKGVEGKAYYYCFREGFLRAGEEGGK